MDKVATITPSYICFFWKKEARPPVLANEFTKPIYNSHTAGWINDYDKSIGYTSMVAASKDRSDKKFNLTLIRNLTKGKVSHNSAKRIRLAVNILNELAKWKKGYASYLGRFYEWKLNLMTLTLPYDTGAIMLMENYEYFAKLKFTPYTSANVAFEIRNQWYAMADKYIKRTYLNQFLIEFTKRYSPSGYVWKAEAQRNGNLHFHITTDKYVHYDALQGLWNRILAKGNYVKKFNEKYGHDNPPSTHITAVERIHDMAGYIIKELSKNQSNRRTVTGKLWGCSKNLSPGHKCQVVITGREEELLERHADRFYVGQRQEKYFTLYFRKKRTWQTLLPNSLLRPYENWLNELRPPPRAKKVRIRT